jgi:hypothetical protein
MTNVSDSDKVTAYLNQLEPKQAADVQVLREFILSIDPEISEEIKWNSPSFYFNGEMKPFDPKTYKRDILVINLHRGKILFVLPTGAIINDAAGILEGAYTDGRRIMNINNLEDFNNKKEGLKLAILDWLRQVER